MSDTKDECVICNLLSGALAVSMVYRDNSCSAFMDIQPVNSGHVLVVPNRHTRYLSGLKEEEGAQIFREGINFFLADGEAAGQEVFHVHLHVFPRYVGDGFRLVLPPTYSDRPVRQELDALAEKIRSTMAGE